MFFCILIWLQYYKLMWLIGFWSLEIVSKFHNNTYSKKNVKSSDNVLKHKKNIIYVFKNPRRQICWTFINIFYTHYIVQLYSYKVILFLRQTLFLRQRVFSVNEVFKKIKVLMQHTSDDSHLFLSGEYTSITHSIA